MKYECWLCHHHKRQLVESRPKLYYNSVCALGHRLDPKNCGSFSEAKVAEISLPSIDKSIQVV